MGTRRIGLYSNEIQLGTGHASIDPGQADQLIDVAAEADVNDITDYLFQEGADRAAVRLVGTILDLIEALATMPLRGAVPKEMEGAAGRGFRQFGSGRYRVIYHVGTTTVSVVLVADGRRDMRSLLTERLLAS